MNTVKITYEFPSEASTPAELEPNLMEFNMKVSDEGIAKFGSHKSRITIQIVDENGEIFPNQVISKPRDWSWGKFFNVLKAGKLAGGNNLTT
jgi:hypothetical protein